MNILERIRAWQEQVRFATASSGTFWQYHCAIELASVVVDEAQRQTEHTGSRLYAHIPTHMAPELIKKIYDPFNKHYDKKDLYRWIVEHLVFGPDGQVIAIYHDGQILACEEGFETDVDRYVKMRKDADGIRRSFRR